MVREARFSWDDLVDADRVLRHERPDDFAGGDDEWVEDLSRSPGRRKSPRRRRRARAKPPRRPRSDAGPGNSPRAAPDPRRHLADADWLHAPARPARHDHDTTR
ncbi:MAG TPA: hypothetical protein VML55_08450 [Planctomycetaceae bacterium]|nr:hypothetical protein [Planctomycetaceae bacterium]